MQKDFVNKVFLYSGSNEIIKCSSWELWLHLFYIKGIFKKCCLWMFFIVLITLFTWSLRTYYMLMCTPATCRAVLFLTMLIINKYHKEQWRLIWGKNRSRSCSSLICSFNIRSECSDAAIERGKLMLMQLPLHLQWWIGSHAMKTKCGLCKRKGLIRVW